ncbi:hypothetical protein [Actinomadura alba]|uniref:Uncharacterized protein n=1 Tax=Actinomadura alba TaxID=406431 RepID=A0ABR7LW82_9ACTN|nr:hypothetical protein [Actinomadura alba]MBC6469103.1 hypothetical protein [Actinomadura alba]
MNRDDIPPHVRAALVTQLFGDWLDAIPTARDAWTLSCEEIARKQENAGEISDRMDWLLTETSQSTKTGGGRYPTAAE